MGRPSTATLLTPLASPPDEMPAFVARTVPPLCERGHAVRYVMLFEPRRHPERVLWTDADWSYPGELAWTRRGVYHGHQRLIRIDPISGESNVVSPFPDDSQRSISILSSLTAVMLVRRNLDVSRTSAVDAPERRSDQQLYWFWTSSESCEALSPDALGRPVSAAIHPHRQEIAAARPGSQGDWSVVLAGSGAGESRVIATRRSVDYVGFSADGEWLAWRSEVGIEVYRLHYDRLEVAGPGQVVAWLGERTMLVLNDHVLTEIDMGPQRRERVIGALRPESAVECTRLRPSPDGRWIAVEARAGLSIIDRATSSVWYSSILGGSMAWRPLAR